MAKFNSSALLIALFLLFCRSDAKIYDHALLENIDEMGELIMVEYAISMHSINSQISQFFNSDANGHVSLLSTPSKYRNSTEYNDSKYKPANASEAWASGGSAWPYEDWRKDPLTVKESGAQTFFSDWVSNFLFQIHVATIFPALAGFRDVVSTTNCSS
jgi:hypothetical protein